MFLLSEWACFYFSSALVGSRESDARQVLSDEELETAFADGEKLSLDEAIDLVWKIVEEMFARDRPNSVTWLADLCIGEIKVTVPVGAVAGLLPVGGNALSILAKGAVEAL
jgi:hypothetical protein